jgi:hypothetical protein
MVATSSMMLAGKDAWFLLAGVVTCSRGGIDSGAGCGAAIEKPHL